MAEPIICSDCNARNSPSAAEGPPLCRRCGALLSPAVVLDARPKKPPVGPKPFRFLLEEWVVERRDIPEVSQAESLSFVEAAEKAGWEIRRADPSERPRLVISVRWFKAGAILPSGDRNERDSTMLEVDGIIGPVGWGDRIVYLPAE